jgi:RNA polymerase sigma factor (sigma-70 family)
MESALDKIINDEERAWLKKAWQKLNYKEKRILYLHYFHEWGYEEIGDILDLKATAVRKAAERARNKILMWLQKKS